MPQTVSQLLREAREKIALEENWTRGAFARNEAGRRVGLNNFEATCWCAWGALVEAGRRYPVDAIDRAEELLREAAGGSIIDLNDGSGTTLPLARHPRRAPARHRKVLAAFDRAIELAEAEERCDA